MAIWGNGVAIFILIEGRPGSGLGVEHLGTPAECLQDSPRLGKSASHSYDRTGSLVMAAISPLASLGEPCKAPRGSPHTPRPWQK